MLAAARSAAGTGGRLTIQDLQSQEGLDPSDVSKAVGRLKKEGALLIVQGGCVSPTGRPSPTAERRGRCLRRCTKAPRELEAFSESDRQIIQEYAVKRGNAKNRFASTTVWLDLSRWRQPACGGGASGYNRALLRKKSPSSVPKC